MHLHMVLFLQLDFSSIYHILVDRGVVLHVLTPAQFTLQKQSLANTLLGECQ